MALLSRYPLDDVRWHTDSNGDWPYVSARVQSPKGDVQIVAIHPPPPMRPRHARSRNGVLRDSAQMLVGEGPRILLGDFNCTPWSPYFRRLRKATGLCDAALGRGLVWTWYPTRLPLGIPIDHVLVSPDLAVADYQVGPNLGSDHRAVTVDLSFR